MRDSWKKIQFESLGYTFGGLTNKTKDDFGKGKPYIPYLNIFENSRIDSDFLEYVQVRSNERQNKVQNGDLFFTTSSETPHEVGMTSVLLKDLGEAYLNSFCFGFRLHNFEDLDPEFASYLFRGKDVRKSISDLAQGSTRYNLSKSILFDKLYLNLPPIPQQQKIAKILSTCDSVIEQTEKAIAKYQAIKQGMMQDLFTRGIDIKTGKLRPKFEDAPELYKESKLGMIPKDWEVSTIDNMAFLRHGYQFRDYDFVQDDGIEVVKIGQVGRNGKLDLSKASKIGRDRIDEFRNILLHEGDVLMALTGATLGKTAMIKGDYETLVQNYRVGYFTPRDETTLEKAFLYFSLIGEHVQNEILGFINAGAQGNIGKADFEKIKFSYPTNLDEQKIISKSLQSLDDKMDLEQKSLSKHQQIKSGLMQDLLSGKVEVKIKQEEVA